jgi:hypothetical protein
MFVGSVASSPRTIDPWNGTPPEPWPYQSPTTTTHTPFWTVISCGSPKMAERPRSAGASGFVMSNTMSPRYEFK